MTLYTQREEDIKEFERDFCKLYKKRSEISGNYYNPKLSIDQFGFLKETISNIYIKIAEAQIKRWTEVFNYHQDMSNENDTYKRNIARVELYYWQEELNKLKS